MNEAEVRRAEEGFTVAELVIAAAILFFVLTAMIGLMGAASQMNVMAKQRAVLTDAVASYIDQQRGSTWDTIVTPSSPATFDFRGIHVTVYMTVETQNDDNGTPYLKVLRVTATSDLGGQTQSYTTRVAIRNPDYGGALTTDPDAPIIVWNDTGWSDPQVVFGSERQSPSGSAINLATISTSPKDQIDSVKYYVNGSLLQQVSGSGEAIFNALPPQTPFLAQPTTWYTPQVPDGLWQVTAIANDTAGRSTSISRPFIVDNDRPGAPGVPSCTPINASDVAFTWTPAQDGGQGIVKFFASSYHWVLTREPTSGGSSDPTSWTQVSQGDAAPNGADLAAMIQNANSLAATSAPSSSGAPFYSRTVPPFSRMCVRVYSGSARFSAIPGGGNNPNYADSTPLAVTRPELLCETGHSSCSTSTITYNKNKSPLEDYLVTLWVSKPQFPSNISSAVYSVEYRDTTNAGAWTQLSTSPTLVSGTWNVATSDPNAIQIKFKQEFNNGAKNAGTGRALMYRVTVSGVSATGYGGPVTVPALVTNSAGSTAVGPSPNTATTVTTALFSFSAASWLP